MELTCTVYVGWLSCVVCFDGSPTSKVVLQGAWSSVSLHTTSLTNLIRHNWRHRTWERQKPGQKRRRGGRKQRWWRTGVEQWQEWTTMGRVTRGSAGLVARTWCFTWHGKAFSFSIVLRCFLRLCQIVHHHPPVSFCTMSLRHLQLNYCRKMRVYIWFKMIQVLSTGSNSKVLVWDVQIRSEVQELSNGRPLPWAMWHSSLVDCGSTCGQKGWWQVSASHTRDFIYVVSWIWGFRNFPMCSCALFLCTQTELVFCQALCFSG